MRNTTTETVTTVHQRNESLFSYKSTSLPTFTFESGQFVMIRLNVDGEQLLRAYSIASANYEDELEFFSIKVPDGALTSRFQHIKVGERLTLSTHPAGTLIAWNLNP